MKFLQIPNNAPFPPNLSRPFRRIPSATCQKIPTLCAFRPSFPKTPYLYANYNTLNLMPMKTETTIDDIKALFETLDFENRIKIFTWIKRQVDYPDQDSAAIKRQIRTLSQKIPMQEVINALMDNSSVN
jgi:hypothetical protein